MSRHGGATKSPQGDVARYEPTVYTADICAEVGHEHCKGIDRTIEGYAGEPVFCNCLCHRLIAGGPN
jgi:hypothetical protein